jgi:restriction system protein
VAASEHSGVYRATETGTRFTMTQNTIQVVDITPTEFERQVKTWLEKSSDGLKKFHATHRKKIEGSGGEYEIDVVAEFEALGGASIVVLIECKYYSSSNPIKRDTVMTLHAKVQDVGAHKGILFSTSGFQKGALEYAKAHGIATVQVEDGGNIGYATKELGSIAERPPWVPHYQYIGWLTTLTDEGNESRHLVADDYHEAIRSWLNSDQEA